MFASSKSKAKMKATFCCSMVIYQTIAIPLRTNQRILKYLLLRQKAHICSYLHSPTRIYVNYSEISQNYDISETISAREKMIAELESVAQTDPESVDKTLESEWLFYQCDQLSNPSHRGH